MATMTRCGSLLPERRCQEDHDASYSSERTGRKPLVPLFHASREKDKWGREVARRYEGMGEKRKIKGKT